MSEHTGRLLMVSSDTYPPFRVDVTVLFGEELAARGYQVDLVLQSEAECGSAYAAAWPGGSVFVGPADRGTSLWRRMRKHALSIAHDLKTLTSARRGRYDVIVVRDKFVSGLWALLVTRLWRVKFVYWLSYPFPEEYLTRAADGTARYPILYRIRGLSFSFLLYKVLLPRAAHVFVQSERMKEDVVRHGLDAGKITPVPMGIRDENARIPIVHRPAAGELTVLYLGSLSRVRRLDFLVRAFSHVSARHASARLLFVGKGDDPDDEKFLEAEVERLSLGDRVRFVGQVPQDEALRYVQSANVCVSPIYPVPIMLCSSPTKLVEYMAMGRPVVANDIPDQKLVIDSSGAGICVTWDEREFAEAVNELLEDPRRAEEMGRRGREWVAMNRVYSRLADSVASELDELISRGGSNPAR